MKNVDLSDNGEGTTRMKVRCRYWQNSQLEIEFDVEGADWPTVLRLIKDESERLDSAHVDLYGFQATFWDRIRLMFGRQAR